MAAKYRWKITKDRVSDGEDNGVEGPRNLDPKLSTNPTHFSLYDDDEECYYQGMLYGEFSGFEPLYDFGIPNAGCTMIKLNGEWL